MLHGQTVFTTVVSIKNFRAFVLVSTGRSAQIVGQLEQTVNICQAVISQAVVEVSSALKNSEGLKNASSSPHTSEINSTC